MTHPIQPPVKSVLLTAFEPYGEWTTNASWLCVVELTRDMPPRPKVTTRLYPVDYEVVRRRLAADLAADYDLALHLGQAPGSTAIRLEQIAINIAGLPGHLPEEYGPLCDEGPIAYTSPLPLGDWAARIRASGIPCQVSHHAGTYLCNATLYWSCHLSAQMRLKTRSAFVHLPLDVSTVVAEPSPPATLPAAMAARAVRTLLETI